MSIPRATYRVQFQPTFRFDAAAALAGYFSALGVSHLYCSPILQAAPRSTHGYDVVDHASISTELGGDRGLVDLSVGLRAAQVGLVLDVVPNHMAITDGNGWWFDVLANGPSSRFAAYFDVDWDPPEERLRDVMLLPVLDDHYGRVLERGGFALRRTRATVVVEYSEHRYPIGPRSLGTILARAARQANSEKLAFLADAFAELPRPTASDRASVRRRHRDIRVLTSNFHQLLSDASIARAVDEAIAAVAADHDALDDLLQRQNYRLAWWKSAAQDSSYRRFFDISNLIGLRTEDDQIFKETHRRLLEAVAAGVADGLRVDHPDGLRDPQAYFDRLHAAAPDAWIVVEKILTGDERLRASWPVAGSVGYEFLNLVTRLAIDPHGEAALTRCYQEFTGDQRDFSRVAHDATLDVLRDVLASDVSRLADLLLRICERHRRYRDYTRHYLTEALREIIAAFPVYRTYVQPNRAIVAHEDRRAIEQAIAAATTGRADLEPGVFEFVQSILLLETTGEREAEFVWRFQQFTGPAMAKGTEDTALYRFVRFLPLNDVGGDPARFSASIDEFHEDAHERATHWPSAMLTTGTHDTKRGEDVRARLAVLSECPDRWAAATHEWSSVARRRAASSLDPAMEYYLYQTIVGSWPISAERLRQHLEKAAREARVHTSWTAPHETYEAALREFVTALTSDAAVMQSIGDFVASISAAGFRNSLAQLLLKLTAPGVPDIYQGSELWDFRLVDPDNRHPIDFDTRRKLQQQLSTLTVADICARMEEGLPKLWVTQAALALRARRPECFDASAEYTPLLAQGPDANRVVAFRRGPRVIAVVSRFTQDRPQIDAATTIELPAGCWRNVLGDRPACGGPALVCDVLDAFPIALLERVES